MLDDIHGPDPYKFMRFRKALISQTRVVLIKVLVIHISMAPGSSPAEIRPGRPISGPEAILRNIG